MRPSVRVCRIGRIMATLYSSIKDDLLAKIKDGTYKEGDIIPPEVELAKSYGVSRPTIRQALQILANDGYIEKRKRRGTIVTKPKVSQGLTMGVRSFEEDMSREGRVVRSTVVIFKREKASEEVAANLELKPRAEVYKLVRLRYVDEKPNVFVESYIPVEPYPNFESYDFTTERMYGAMTDEGHPVTQAHRRLDVIKADSATAALLDVEVGDPLFLFHTVGREADGRAVEYSVATYRGENNTFEFNVSREEA